MCYLLTHYVAYGEVRVNLEQHRLRLDLVAVARWSNKKPKDSFGVEIKSSLADFEKDTKWEHYLQFCHYFCFAVLGNNRELVQKIESQTPNYVGILLL